MALLKVLGTLYNEMKSCYLILTTWCFFFRTPIDEWRSGDLCTDSNGTPEGTWYLVLGTSYNEVLLLDTNYLILFFSNADWWMKKWGFVYWLKWHFWRYLVPCTSYNEVLLLDTNYLILFLISNAELRLMNEEEGFVFWLKWHSLSYFVPCTMKWSLATWY